MHYKIYFYYSKCKDIVCITLIYHPYNFLNSNSIIKQSLFGDFNMHISERYFLCFFYLKTLYTNDNYTYVI